MKTSQQVIISDSTAVAFVFIDAALVLLWITSAGCFCLRAPQARVHVDVRLDLVLRRSRDPGNTAKDKTSIRETGSEYMVWDTGAAY